MLAATLRCGNSRSSWKIMPIRRSRSRRSIRRRRVEQRLAAEPDAAGFGPRQAGDQPEQGRLARPRRPEHDADLAAEPQSGLEGQSGMDPCSSRTSRTSGDGPLTARASGPAWCAGRPGAPRSRRRRSQSVSQPARAVSLPWTSVVDRQRGGLGQARDVAGDHHRRAEVAQRAGEGQHDRPRPARARPGGASPRGTPTARSGPAAGRRPPAPGRPPRTPRAPAAGRAGTPPPPRRPPRPTSGTPR